MRSELGLGAIVLAIASASCSGTYQAKSSAAPAGEFLQRLAIARAQWETQHPSEYMFRVYRTCYCQPRSLSATVVVRGDSVDRIMEVVADGVPGETNMRFFTIDQLFDNIATADPTRCFVQYDESLGVPVIVEFGRMADDSGVQYQIKDLGRVLHIETGP